MSVSPSSDAFFSLLGFFILPVIIFISAVYTYLGLVEGRTLTHFGMRGGWIAKLYAIFYGLLGVLALVGFVYFTTSLVQIGLSEIVRTVVAPMPISINYPTANFVFVGIGLVFLLLGYVVTKITRLAQDAERKSYVRRRMYTAGIICLLIAVVVVPGVPVGCTLLLMVAPFYLDPAVNPYNAMRFGV